MHSITEVKNTLECKCLNIAILAETKIRLEDDLQDLKIDGYDYFQIRRSDENEDKQGGGLICYMKKDTTVSYEIPFHKIEDEKLQYVQKERGWIISKTFKQKQQFALSMLVANSTIIGMKNGTKEYIELLQESNKNIKIKSLGC